MKHIKTPQELNKASENLNTGSSTTGSSTISDVSISKNYFIEQFNKLPKCYHKEWVDIDELKKVYSYDDIQKFIKLGWIESDGAEYDMARPSFKLK